MTLGVIIVAAGKSQRMGFDKLTHPLGDSFVLQHSVSKFCNCGNVAQVCIATDQKRFSQLQPHDKIFRVDGGTERQNSVANGIEKLSNCDFIAVHDGARPLISSIQIQKVFRSAQDHKAATSAKRITDTLKRSNGEDFCQKGVSRDHLWAMETPQMFEADLLRSAYQSLISNKENVTDEASAMELIGVKTKLVANESPNLKITYPEDIPLAEHLLSFLS